MTRLPYCVIVSDGVLMRSLHGLAFGADRAALEAIIDRALGPPPAITIEITRPAPKTEPNLPSPTLHATSPKVEPMLTQVELARAQGYAGDPCDTCQQFRLKRSGHCMVCDSCGTTTGCS